MAEEIRCEGWRRQGGAFTLGLPRWEQCENRAIVNLAVDQNGIIKTMPACFSCWKEAIDAGIDIKRAIPIGDPTERDAL